MSLVDGLTVTAAVGCGLVGGVFLAFSAFVMAGLRRLPAPQGIAAMQAINVTAVRAPLMVLLLGTAALVSGLAVHAVLDGDGGRAALVVAAAVVDVAGTVLLTGAFHVPRNDALATLDPDAPGAAEQWATYAREWTAVNHLRALAGAGSAALLVVALL